MVFPKSHCISLSGRYYSTYIKTLHPAFISGFIDAEGCFLVFITENEKLDVGGQVRLFFSIELHSHDANILKQIKAYFNNIHSTISINEKGKSIKLEINSIKDLVVLIKYFEKYSLITQKRVDFEL